MRGSCDTSTNIHLELDFVNCVKCLVSTSSDGVGRAHGSAFQSLINYARVRKAENVQYRTRSFAAVCGQILRYGEFEIRPELRLTAGFLRRFAASQPSDPGP